MRARPSRKWDEFKEIGPRRLPDQLYASILPKKAEFIISGRTFHKLNEPEAVVLLFDRESQTIGVRPSRLDVPHAVPVRRFKDRTAVVFRSTRFLAKHRIFLKQAVEFPTAAIDTEGILILNLRDIVPATNMSGRKPKI